MSGRFAGWCGRSRTRSTNRRWTCSCSRSVQDEGTEDWRAVRAAQERYADEAIHLVLEDAVTFAESGNMQDIVHYDQTGYDRMGRAGAERVAAIVADGDG